MYIVSLEFIFVQNDFEINADIFLGRNITDDWIDVQTVLFKLNLLYVFIV